MAEQTAELLPPDALEKNAPRVIHPLAGFWFRLGALALDLFLLRLTLQLTYPALRPLYLNLGGASAAVAFLLIFLYILLAEGAIGKGMTVGKAILGIRTTDLRGERPAPTAVAARAALLLVLALPLVAGQIEAPLRTNPNHGAILAVRAATYCLPIAYILANVFLVVLHPLKQTVHDMAAGTLVLREAGAHNLAAFLEQAEGQIAPLRRRALTVAAIAFVAFGALNLFSVASDILSADSERALGFLRSFDKEFRHASMAPRFQPTLFGWIDSRLVRDGLTTASWAGHLPALRASPDYPTSSSFVLCFEYRSRSAITAQALGTSESMADLAARAASWTRDQVQQNNYPLDAKSRTHDVRGKTILFQPRFVALLFVEQVHLVLYGSEKVVWADVLPLGIPADFYEKEEQAVTKQAPRLPKLQDTLTTAPVDRSTTGPVAATQVKTQKAK